MVTISKNGQKIIVSCDPSDNALKNEDHRIFLEICGFEEKTKYRKFEIIAEDPADLIYQLKEEFDIDEEIEFEGEIPKLFADQKNAEKEFQAYQKDGMRLKKDRKSPKIKLFGLTEGFKLKPYQQKSVKHLVTIPNAANFSIPGSGKTIMTYAGFYILKQQGKIDQLIVIGPRASFGPWKTEFEMITGKKWEHNVLQYHASADKRSRMRKNFKNFDVILTTYDTASNDLIPLIQYFRSSKKKILLVLDESHRIKSIKETTESGRTTRSENMIQLGENATRRCILSGTPLPHEWDDLWAQITFLWPQTKPLGSREEYENMIDSRDVARRVGNIINFMWTRVSTKHVKKDLPKQKMIRIHVEMDQIQEEIYSTIRTRLIANIPSGRTMEKVREWRRARVIRLLQVVTNPRLIVERDPVYSSLAPSIQGGGRENVRILRLVQRYHKDHVSNKIKQAAELARKLSYEKKNVVIFTHFRGNVRLLLKILADKKPIGITGQIADADIQEKLIEEFKNWNLKDGKGKILVATAGTVAESVSLHRNKDKKHVCNNAIFLERSYDAGKYMQALHRIYRIGSLKSRPVNYYIFMSKFADGTTTIDNTIDEVLDTRVTRLFELLDDEFRLHVVSLDTAKKAGEEQFYTEGMNEDDIMKKIASQESKNKKVQKR